MTRSLGRHSWSIWNLKMITFNILLIDATSFYHTATSSAPTSFRWFWRTRGDETPTASCIGGLEIVNGIELLSMRVGDPLVDRRLNARGLKQRVEGRFLVIQELNLHQNHIPCPLYLWPPIAMARMRQELLHRPIISWGWDRKLAQISKILILEQLAKLQPQCKSIKETTKR